VKEAKEVELSFDNVAQLHN